MLNQLIIDSRNRNSGTSTNYTILFNEAIKNLKQVK